MGNNTVRLTHIDGTMPNLALMRLSAHFKAQGTPVYFTRTVEPDLFEPRCRQVYGSSIFSFSELRRRRFLANFPDSILGGTGTGDWTTLEEVIPSIGSEQDYSIYPEVDYSIGFLSRGCRLKCPFCVVPRKEGGPRANRTVHQIWRGDPWPRKLHLLDNDFFGVPDWSDHLQEIREGNFRVCLSQGVNVRMITEATAAALASIEYRDTKFQRRRLYTAWDNLGDESRFFKGVELLNRAGIPYRHLVVYMLVGYAQGETWPERLYRFHRMADLGILPYPMVYDNAHRDLKRFQRWAVTGLYKMIPWEQYSTRRNRKGR